MNDFQIFGLQVMLSLIAFALIAKHFLWPRLQVLSLREALTRLVFLHTFRHLGLLFLVTVVVDPALPRGFAIPVAYGDLLAVVFAYLVLVALWKRWSLAIGLVWLFNIVGTADFLNAFYQGTRLNITQYQLGAAWLIPTFGVPFLLVIHYLIFVILLKRRKESLA